MHWEQLIAASLIGHWMDTGQPNPLPLHLTVHPVQFTTVHHSSVHCIALSRLQCSAWGLLEKLALQFLCCKYRKYRGYYKYCGYCELLWVALALCHQPSTPQLEQLKHRTLTKHNMALHGSQHISLNKGNSGFNLLLEES